MTSIAIAITLDAMFISFHCDDYEFLYHSLDFISCFKTDIRNLIYDYLEEM